MIWFIYNYTNFNDIIKNIVKINSYREIDIMILISLLILTLFLIYFFIPYIKVFFITKEEEKKKKEKKQLVNKIILQKNLEDIIAKEETVH